MDSFENWIKHRVRNVQLQLEEILETKTEKIKFEVQTEWSNFRNTSKDPIHCFSQLSPYFDSGLFLVRKSHEGLREDWSLACAFHLGKFYPLNSDWKNRTLALPYLRVGEIRKSSATRFVQELQIQEIAKPGQSCFFFKINSENSLILLSSLAEPWQKIQIEKARLFIMSGLESQ